MRDPLSGFRGDLDYLLEVWLAAWADGAMRDSHGVLLSPGMYRVYRSALDGSGDFCVDDEDGHAIMLDANCSVDPHPAVPDNQIWVT